VGREPERLRRIDHRNGGYLFLGGRSMLKSKFFNFLFILIFLVPLVGSGCIFGDDDDDDEKERLQQQIITNKEESTAATAAALKLAEGNAKVALELAIRNADAAKLAADNAAKELAILVANDASDALIAAAKDKADALEKAAIDAEGRLTIAVANVSREAENKRVADLQTQRLADEKEARRVRLQHHEDLDAHNIAHADLVEARTNFNTAISNQGTAAGELTTAQTAKGLADTAVSEARKTLEDAADADKEAAQTALTTAISNQTTAAGELTGKQTAKGLADTAVSEAQTALDAAILAVNE